MYPEDDATVYRHNKATIDRGFEFVNIQSVNLNLVTKCFLTREVLLIVGLNLLMMLSLCLELCCWGFSCGGGVSGPWGPGGVVHG